MIASSAVVRATLADHCVGVVKLACGPDLAQASDAAALSAKVDAQFSDFESRAQRAGAPLEDTREAKYALCALIDERVMASSSTAREQWAANPLQLRHFDDFAAGEVFFDKLDALRAAGAARLDVLEIYGICLALGFTGRHTGERGAERRRILLDQVVSEVSSARVGPAADPSGPYPLRLAAGGRTRAWIPALTALAVALGVYLVVHAWVRFEVDRFARDLSLGQGIHGT